jgi:hypothetical protein
MQEGVEKIIQQRWEAYRNFNSNSLQDISPFKNSAYIKILKNQVVMAK